MPSLQRNPGGRAPALPTAQHRIPVPSALREPRVRCYCAIAFSERQLGPQIVVDFRIGLRQVYRVVGRTMSLKANHKGPLSGYRIVDLSSHITGPYATMLLADQGAEVIRVESPAGDLMRQGGTSRNNLAAFFITSNRNKQSIALDLKKPEAIEALCRLVETADVFVQNYRPGVAERLGLGEQVLRNRKKDLIYVSISGFGATGPYASRRVYDTVIQAISGFPHIQKGTRKTPEIARTVVADKVTAQTVAQGVTGRIVGP